MREVTWLMEEHNKFVDKQNKAMKQTAKPGRVSIDSIGQLRNLPGVKHIKRNK